MSLSSRARAAAFAGRQFVVRRASGLTARLRSIGLAVDRGDGGPVADPREHKARSPLRNLHRFGLAKGQKSRGKRPSGRFGRGEAVRFFRGVSHAALARGFTLSGENRTRRAK